MVNFTPIIGLEIHVQINTQTKAFCSCSTDYFGHEPNTHVCPVCLGYPGALPVLNEELVRRAVLLGLALDAKISQDCFFERKNYFYPDNPKAYQITQFQKPIVKEGKVKIKINNQEKIIRIHEAHIEEDAAKSIHMASETLIDFNKAGMPLFEIVSQPDMSDPQEVELYAGKIQQIIRYLGIADADIEKGNMRVEPTVNLEIMDKQGQKHYTPLVEIKNIASLKFARSAVEYEIQRQLKKWQEDKEEKSSTNKTTRGYDSQKGVTFLQRDKEGASDYRYFPEPDLPPLEISNDFIAKLKQELPELPDAKLARYLNLGISEVDALILTQDLDFSKKFGEAIGTSQDKDFVKFTANRFLGSCRPLLQSAEIIDSKLFTSAYETVKTGLANTNVINEALRQSLETGKPLADFYKPQTSDANAIEGIVNKIILENLKAVEDYKKNPASIGFLLGQVIKSSGGTASPQVAREVLEKILKKNG